MNRFAIRLLTLAMLSLALTAAPVVSVVYAAPDNDPPPPPKKPKKSEARPGTEETAFADGYRAAYAAIYDRHDYASAIEQLKALGHDDLAMIIGVSQYIPLRELATVAGITYGAARVRLHRLRERLRKLVLQHVSSLATEEKREIERFLKRAGISLESRAERAGGTDDAV